MPAIRIDNRDYEEVAVRRIRDTVPVSIGSSVLPPDAATETTLQQVRDAIKAQIDLETTIWTDDSGAYYVRQDLVDEGTGVITIAWTTPDGTSTTPGPGLKPLASADRDVTQNIYEVTGNGTGYTTGDLLARILILDVTPSTPAITELWYNLSSGTVISAPLASTVRLIGDTVTVGNGPGNPVIAGAPVRTPVTTQVVSSTVSVEIVPGNPDRRGISVANLSLQALYLSFGNPATLNNCFVRIPANSFVLLDQQLIIANSMYGFWDGIDGAAQVTEFE